jgi:hypothetical protein
MGMEIGIFKFIMDIFKSAPKFGAALAIFFILIFAAWKLLPIFLNFFKDILASRRQDQGPLLDIIREELSSNRAQADRQFDLNERHTKSLEGAVELLREVSARTASMDHRIFEGLTEMTKCSAGDHKQMSNDLQQIKGYISGLS